MKAPFGGSTAAPFLFWRFLFWRVLGGFLPRSCRVFGVCHVSFQSLPVFLEQGREDTKK